MVFIERPHNENIEDLIRFVSGLPALKTFKFTLSPLAPTNLIQFLKTCEPIHNLQTICLVIPKNQLQNKVNEIKNIMNDELKNIFNVPVSADLSDFPDLKDEVLKSIEFYRKSKK